VQAVPAFIPSGAKKFSDLEASDYRMTESSKAALSLAVSVKSERDVVAIGFPPVLREALVRGATNVVSVPLCDDPLEQSGFVLNAISAKESTLETSLVLGENSEWVFSGASLAGALAQRLKLKVRLLRNLDAQLNDDLVNGSVVIVSDSLVGDRGLVGNVDVRRISLSFAHAVNPEGVLGDSTLLRQEPSHPEIISGDSSEISSALVRKLRRIVTQD
jgi:hypothetical protein